MTTKKTAKKVTAAKPVERSFNLRGAKKLIAPYRHPDTARTVLFHEGESCFTPTGMYAGPLTEKAEKIARDEAASYDARKSREKKHGPNSTHSKSTAAKD